MEEQVTAVTQQGWFQSLKQKLNVDALVKKMNLSKSRMIEIGIYLSIGFIAGFLFKKYGKYLFVVLATIVGIFILQQFNIVDVAINWNKIQGIQPIAVPVGADVWSIYWAWIKLHFIVILSFSVGFFVGFKVG